MYMFPPPPPFPIPIPIFLSLLGWSGSTSHKLPGKDISGDPTPAAQLGSTRHYLPYVASHLTCPCPPCPALIPQETKSCGLLTSNIHTWNRGLSVGARELLKGNGVKCELTRQIIRGSAGNPDSGILAPHARHVPPVAHWTCAVSICNGGVFVFNLSVCESQVLNQSINSCWKMPHLVFDGGIKTGLHFSKKFPSFTGSQLSGQLGEFPVFDSLRFRQEAVSSGQRGCWECELRHSGSPGPSRGLGRVTAWTLGPIQLSPWPRLPLGLFVMPVEGGGSHVPEIRNQCLQKVCTRQRAPAGLSERYLMTVFDNG